MGNSRGTKRWSLALVVDDDRLTRDALAVMLKNRGVVTVMAENGKEAVNKFAVFNPDLVITDLDMPVMDGFRLMAELLSIGSTVPVVVYSADDRAKERAIFVGASEFICKGAAPSEIMGAIEKHLPVTDLARPARDHLGG